MSRWKWNWLTTLLTSAGALSVGALGCGDTTNNYASCGPGTRHDPDLNACVPIEDGGGAGAGDAGDAGTTGSDAAGDVEADAGNEAGVEAGPEPQPGDDTCRTDVSYYVNGDKACGTYNAVNTCTETEPGTLVLEPLTLEDLMLEDPADLSSGGVWVRTPSHPGSNPMCGIGCSREGVIAKVLIPVVAPGDFGADYYVRHEDPDNEMDPWRITVEYVDKDCANTSESDCYGLSLPGEQLAYVILETSDPNAPARNFHIFDYGSFGACNGWE